MLGQPLGSLAVAVFLDAVVNIDSNLVQLDRDRHLAVHGYLHRQNATSVDHSVGRVKMEIPQLCEGVHGQHYLVTCKHTPPGPVPHATLPRAPRSRAYTVMRSKKQ